MTAAQAAAAAGLSLALLNLWEGRYRAWEPAILKRNRDYVGGPAHRREYAPWQVLKIQAAVSLRRDGVSAQLACMLADAEIVRWYHEHKSAKFYLDFGMASH